MSKTSEKSHENTQNNVNSDLEKALEQQARKRKPQLEDSTNLVKDWCYHNTRKLLRKYRHTKMCIAVALDDLEDDLNDELGARFSSLFEFASYVDVDLSGTYLESRLKTMKQNRMMLGFIDKAMDSMRKYDRNGEEFYWLLYLKYMAPYDESCTKDYEIVEKLKEKGIHATIGTFYRRLNQATDTLSEILWGYTTRDVLHISELLEKIKKDKG